MPSRIVAAHAFCSKHRAKMATGDTCGCFHCGTTFSSSDVTDWIDDDQTALCPVCGVDAVLPSACVSGLDQEFLGEMKKHWF